MNRIVIFGAGGHGREVADVVRAQIRSAAGADLIGFLDDDEKLHGKEIGGIRVLGDLSWFDGLERSNVRMIVAIGQPRIAKGLVERARRRNIQCTGAISPHAYVSPHAALGAGVSVFPHAVVQPDVRLGDHALLNVGATVSHDTVVGPFANINPGACLAGNVRVGEGAFVGMGANVIQGMTIGEWAVVGAGAVVLSDIPPYATAVGVPARVVEQRDIEPPTH